VRFRYLEDRFYQLLDERRPDSAGELLHRFLEKATDSDLAEGLALKAQLLLYTDSRKTPEALLLLERALEASHDAPGVQARVLVRLLRVCRFLGDVDRASGYEYAASLLLKRYGDSPEVIRYRAFLNQNCGRVAQLRGERALALWYFLRAEEAYRVTQPDDAKAWACYRAGNYGNLFGEYMALGRTEEAREALDQARQVCPRDRPVSWSWVAEHEVIWALHAGNMEGARRWLEQLDACRKKVQTPEMIARYLIVCARVAQSAGDLAAANRFLGEATEVAVSHRLDDLLAEIERLQRIPTAAGKGG
jgi:tetratricopeptide (TPR) repeat protein